MSDVDLLARGLCGRGHTIRDADDTVIIGGHVRCACCVADAAREIRHVAAARAARRVLRSS